MARGTLKYIMGAGIALSAGLLALTATTTSAAAQSPSVAPYGPVQPRDTDYPGRPRRFNPDQPWHAVSYFGPGRPPTAAPVRFAAEPAARGEARPRPGRSF